jgi:hypothetical protein
VSLSRTRRTGFPCRNRAPCRVSLNRTLPPPFPASSTNPAAADPHQDDTRRGRGPLRSAPPNADAGLRSDEADDGAREGDGTGEGVRAGQTTVVKGDSVRPVPSASWATGGRFLTTRLFHYFTSQFHGSSGGWQFGGQSLPVSASVHVCPSTVSTVIPWMRWFESSSASTTACSPTAGFTEFPLAAPEDNRPCRSRCDHPATRSAHPRFRP